jgi:hypothetical protein
MLAMSSIANQTHTFTDPTIPSVPFPRWQLLGSSMLAPLSPQNIEKMACAAVIIVGKEGRVSGS